MFDAYRELLRDPLERVLTDTPIRSETFSLSVDEAAHVVSVLWLAQLALSHRATLVVGSRPMPAANQLDDMTREVYARIPIHFVSSSLAPTDYVDAASFGLKCMFEVDADADVRVPLPFWRPGAVPIAWAAFRPDRMDERTSVFIDAPNLPRQYDTFYIASTRENGLLNALDRDTLAAARLHFYADAMPPSTNLFGLTNESDAVVNIEFDGTLTDDAFAAAVRTLTSMPMTRERIHAAVRAVIVEFRTLI